MKRLLFSILCGIAACYFSFPAIAKEEALSLSAAASSEYSDYFIAAKALDGDNTTYWIGARDESPWWITFDTGSVTQVDKIIIDWYYSYYSPEDYDIQISDDGVNWEDISTGLRSVTGVDEEEINRETRYIKLLINSVNLNYPILREFNAYKTIRIPRLVRFQGSLKDVNANALLNGTATLTFRLYDTETGGEPIWEETHADVAIEYGALDVVLGSQTPFDEENAPFDTQYWLGIKVDGDDEMTPRFKLTSVPYAFVSEK